MTKAMAGQRRRRPNVKKKQLVNFFCAEGLSFSEIATELNNRGFRNENGKEYRGKVVKTELERW